MKSLKQLRDLAAFTMPELMVSLAIFGIMAGVTLASLTSMNNRASLSRCQTGASTVAMNQIDLILSMMPFNPQKNQIPDELKDVRLTTDGTEANPTVPIYTDPATNTVLIRGWIDRSIKEVPNSNGLVQATIRVSYKYRGKKYFVEMYTMRSPDI